MVSCGFIHTWASFNTPDSKCAGCGLSKNAFAGKTVQAAPVRKTRSLVRSLTPKIAQASIELDDVDPVDIFGPSTKPVQEPGKRYCSFCGVEVDTLNSVEGTGTPEIGKRNDIVKIGDEHYIEERLVVRNKKKIACKDCCLNIQKITTVSEV